MPTRKSITFAKPTAPAPRVAPMTVAKCSDHKATSDHAPRAPHRDIVPGPPASAPRTRHRSRTHGRLSRSLPTAPVRSLAPVRAPRMVLAGPSRRPHATSGSNARSTPTRHAPHDERTEVYASGGRTTYDAWNQVTPPSKWLKHVSRKRWRAPPSRSWRA